MSVKIWKFWFPVIVYSAIIFTGSAIPHLKPPISGNNVDKLFHLLEYIPFGFLASRAFRGSFPGRTEGWFWWAATFLALLYGLSDEYHQSFVEGRDSEIYDAFADSLGGFLGAWLFIIWNKRQGLKGKN